MPQQSSPEAVRSTSLQITPEMDAAVKRFMLENKIKIYGHALLLMAARWHEHATGEHIDKPHLTKGGWMLPDGYELKKKE